MIYGDSVIEGISFIARLLCWWGISFTLIYIGTKFYFVDKLSVKIKLILILVVFLFSRVASELIVSVVLRQFIIV